MSDGITASYLGDDPAKAKSDENVSDADRLVRLARVVAAFRDVPGGAYVHVNRSDPRDPAEPFCGCHDDPWALCPRWRDWGITEAEHKAAENRAAGSV